MLTITEILQSRQRNGLQPFEARVSQPWTAHQFTRAYSTLYRGHFPGMLWLWWPRGAQERVVLDGSQRITAVMLLCGIPQPGATAPDAQRVEFNVDSGEFRVVGLPWQNARDGAVWVPTADVLRAPERDVVTVISCMLAGAPPTDADTDLQRGLRLRQLRSVLEVAVPVTTVDLPREDVVELLADLN